MSAWAGTIAPDRRRSGPGGHGPDHDYVVALTDASDDLLALKARVDELDDEPAGERRRAADTETARTDAAAARAERGPSGPSSTASTAR